jgi:hypothetical protein
MEWVAGAAWGLFGFFVIVFVLYALGHTALVRPVIGLIERAVGQEGRFPFLDRVEPRDGMTDMQREFMAWTKDMDGHIDAVDQLERRNSEAEANARARSKKNYWE